MNHEVPHDLDMALAHRCVEKAFESYSARFSDYSPTMTWASESLAKVGFNAKGLKLNGSIAIKPKTIELELEVPFLLRIFKAKAMEVIEEEIRMWIGKAKAGQI